MHFCQQFIIFDILIPFQHLCKFVFSLHIMRHTQCVTENSVQCAVQKMYNVQCGALRWSGSTLHTQEHVKLIKWSFGEIIKLRKKPILNSQLFGKVAHNVNSNPLSLWLLMMINTLKLTNVQIIENKHFEPEQQLLKLLFQN